MPPAKIIAAIITAAAVIDGDTIRFDGERLRLRNCDAPEIHTPEGKRAKQFAIDFMADGVTIEFSGRRGYYGRPLVVIKDGEGVTLCAALKKAGLTKRKK